MINDKNSLITKKLDEINFRFEDHVSCINLKFLSTVFTKQMGPAKVRYKSKEKEEIVQFKKKVLEVGKFNYQ
jgi:hypothetical protein